MAKKVIIVGSGFAGLASAACLAKAGFEVTVLEKNSSPGGRARQMTSEGFVFDMGPSWYWMPDVFEQFFGLFGKKVSDYYDLRRLDPSYTINFGGGKVMDVPASLDGLYALFESYEPGSSQNLNRFLKEGAYKYEVGMQEFVHKPGHSILEFADLRVLRSLFRLQMFNSMAGYLRRLFKNEQLIQLLEFPGLFLGATPEKTPALYSLMNYADIRLGTWYPMGGMFRIVEAMVSLASELGVTFRYNQEVTRVEVIDGKAKRVHTADAAYEADALVVGADYHHFEQEVLAPEFRQYNKTYWDKRVMAPSSLLFYMGINKRLPNLRHHNLFFDEDFHQHAVEIYEKPQWPSKPLFYVSAPSVTDPSVAPEGMENLFLLIPLAPGLEDTDALREKYYHIIMERLEQYTGENIREHVVYKRSYAHNDFIRDYHAFKGNAYGLANTLLQTAFLKPKMRSKKVRNLFYAGQLTTPGPGVPPSLISGQVAAKELARAMVP
ncbi:MAG: phytoene desaturase [Haliscomenobacter sp.]|nr:phytoene desaturase [Haliscomenobacter sp.]